jgi:hypothetical protein
MANVPTFRVLCAMARAEIEAEPTICDSEWIERLKCRLVRQRFAYPSPEQLTSTIRAVERVLVQQWGPRP